MEFLELSLLLLVALVLYKKPKFEKLAFSVFVLVFVVVAFVFFALDIQYFLLPPMNL